MMRLSSELTPDLFDALLGEYQLLLRRLFEEMSASAETVAIQILPKDATRRIDAPDPGNCAF